MKTELYTDGDAYQYTEEELIAMTREIVGPFPVVIEDDKIIAVQPWDPDTEQAWSSDAAALAWGAAWIDSVLNPTPVEPAPAE